MPTLNTGKKPWEVPTKKSNKSWAHDPRYHTTRWRTLRKKLLKGKVCYECKKNGKTIPATTLGHVISLQLDSSDQNFWNGEKMYGIKWRNFKLSLVQQKYLTDPALPLGFPHVVNLITDPKEREPYNPVHLHSWTMAHFGRMLKEFQESVKREPLIPAGAPLDYIPELTE